MESVASNSPSASPQQLRSQSHPRFKPAQPIADRIARAFRHPLQLLHRSDDKFFILGATCNVYTVTLSTTPSCTCPDRTIPCKHILFVFLRVLGMSVDDSCLRRRTLRPCQLSRLLGTPTSPESLAGAHLRERFHQLFSQARRDPPRRVTGLEDGATCPICLEEMGIEDRLVACGTCRNPLHEECFHTWKRSRGRRAANCVICRARWRERADQERYLNLGAYVTGDENVGGSSRTPCGG
ncbi:PREDICTED: uncharacterized protein LOC104592084 [Nelumbo nucifera]|uniref:Uncharacterized protein LOC104592084 n=2 Tax=Nelumbo nucifera TaxID=4432 RepID=A0A1U7ZAC4_NELNU|nr:PREDICTED: uncharacterized protein LOC104592084 [Nelumbo nucifera]DAD44637.1 TPA_asm: hypothetical protein HUJ06_002867 [Nelumbo nucifera]